MPKTGGQLIAESFCRNQVKNIFCVPGESYLGALDALFDKKKSIKVINARHEAGAANMAESYGKITGKPGVAWLQEDLVPAMLQWVCTLPFKIAHQ